MPSTLPALAGILRAGQLSPAPGFAVTPALREAYASGDKEELEYVALTAAARASLRLLAEDPEAEPRRVVVVAEVADDAVARADHDADLALDPANVTVTVPVPVAKIVSAHVDDPQATRDIRAAIAALPAADAGDEDAAFDVDQAEGHELGWYATQELPDLLGLVSSHPGMINRGAPIMRGCRQLANWEQWLWPSWMPSPGCHSRSTSQSGSMHPAAPNGQRWKARSRNSLVSAMS